MSKYVTYNCQDMRDREILLAALASIGFVPGKVEVHPTPQTLYDYNGSQRPQKAEIIIRRQNTGAGASNDIGITKQADGSYTMIVSDYDQMWCKPVVAGVGPMPFHNALPVAYATVVANRSVVELLQNEIPQMKADGLIPLRATAVQEEDENEIRVMVRY